MVKYLYNKEQSDDATGLTNFMHTVQVILFQASLKVITVKVLMIIVLWQIL